MDRVEYTIIRNLVRDEDFARKVVPFIDPDYFSVKAERTIIEQIISFFGDYNASPTPEALAIDLGEKRGITESEYSEIRDTLSHIAADAPAPDADWLVDTTEKFCKDRAVFNAVKESIGILDGEGDSSKEAIPEILSKALGVSFDTNVGQTTWKTPSSDTSSTTTPRRTSRLTSTTSTRSPMVVWFRRRSMF